MCNLAHEKLGQLQNIVAAFSQRRQSDLHDVDAKIQISPERAGGDAALQIGVGREDETRVDRHLALGSNRTDPSILQDTQQLALQHVWQLADFIQKQRPALGIHEQTLTGSSRPRKRSLQMAEQFAFDHIRRDRAAIDGNEKLVGTTGQRMQRSGGDLLAGARLARKQDGCRQRRHPRDRLAYFLDCGRVTEQLVTQKDLM